MHAEIGRGRERKKLVNSQRSAITKPRTAIEYPKVNPHTTTSSAQPFMRLRIFIYRADEAASNKLNEEVSKKY